MGREQLTSILCVVNFADSSLENSRKSSKNPIASYPAMYRKYKNLVVFVQDGFFGLPLIWVAL